MDRRIIPAALLLSTSLLGAGAQAQQADAEDSLAEVVVTGTSIKGVAPVGAPVRTLDVQEMAATGKSTTADLVRSIPQFLNLGAEEGRGGLVQNSSANIAQGTGINLRGLGTESTLVLVNGRRVALNGFTGNYVDVSTIPAAAIERLEVVPDGASAIYGSDAVAGVVNIILKKNYSGAESRVRYGGADGYKQTQVQQTLGTTWDSGDLFIAGEYLYRDNLPGDSRQWMLSDLRAYGGPDRRQAFGHPGTIVIGTGPAAVNYAIPNAGVTPATVGTLRAGTVNLNEINASKDYLPIQNKTSFVAGIHQDISDSLKVYYEGYYSDRSLIYRGRTLTASAATAALSVPSTNPFYVNPTGGTGNVIVNYNFQDDVPAITTGGETTFQHALGFTQQLWHDWTLDAYLSRSTNLLERTIDGSLRTINQAAVLSGVPSAVNPTGAAFNPFGGLGYVQNPVALALLNGRTGVITRFTQTDYVAKANGPAFELPAGPLRTAIGYEHLDVGMRNVDSNNATFPTFQVRTQSYLKRTVNAGFAEVFVPVFEKLDLNAAVRREDYSDIGTTTNPKFGLTFRAIDDLSLRASWGKSFRAPTLSDQDITSGASVQATNIVDPRSANANGLTRGLTITGGRSPGDITPEKATTWSIGADWKPAFLSGFKASVTYYDIDYTNRIDTPGVPTLLADETAAGTLVVRNPTLAQVNALLTSPFYSSAPENAANFLLIVDTRKNNIGSTRQSGIDISSSYAFDTGFGGFNASLDVNWITKAARQANTGFPYLDVLDYINNPISTRAKLGLGWKLGNVRADAFMNYVADYKNDTVAPVASVAAFTTLDLTASYTTGESFSSDWLNNLRFSVSAINATDKGPPIVINGVQAFDSQNASPFGRILSVELSKEW